MQIDHDASSLSDHWPDIRAVFARAQESSIHCSIASVSAQGLPNITPMGTLFLRDDCSGFYFDRYPGLLAENLAINPGICVMAVNTGKSYWLRSLLFGRFSTAPGVRLYGKAGPLREATEDELQLVAARTRSTRWLRGNKLLWTSFSHVRDITFSSFRPVAYPVMMDHLWTQAGHPPGGCGNAR